MYIQTKLSLKTNLLQAVTTKQEINCIYFHSISQAAQRGCGVSSSGNTVQPLLGEPALAWGLD